MKDITDKVQFEFGEIDGELLPLTRCVCGEKWITLGIDKEVPDICPSCGRRMIFTNKITVFELEEGK